MCSGAECRVHANVHRGSVVSANLREEMGEPRRADGRIWVERLLDSEVWIQALLDHQELVGEAVGGEWILQALPRPWHVWHQHYGLYSFNSNHLIIKLYIYIYIWFEFRSFPS